MIRPKDILKYRSYFSENKFWEKLGNYAKKAGVKAVYAALLGYFVLKSPQVAVEDKAKIYGALGYFILPLDLIPDMVPVVGYADDLSALIYALHAVWVNITPDIEQEAQTKLKDWFGEVDAKDLKLF